MKHFLNLSDIIIRQNINYLLNIQKHKIWELEIKLKPLKMKWLKLRRIRPLSIIGVN